MSGPGGFDRFMVAVAAAANGKIKRLKREGKEVRWAWFHGVLPIAARSPMRGALMIGSTPADERDIADQADVTLSEARKALRIARELGMLFADEDGIEWVHDFQEWNPEPKHDSSAAERARRYRERQKALRNGSAEPSDDRDANAFVTRDESDANALEGKGREELHPPSPPRGERARDRAVFEGHIKAWASEHFPGAEVGAVIYAMDILRGRRIEPTPDAIREYAKTNAACAEQLGLEAAA